MFQAKAKEICHDIHNPLWNKKTAECSLVDIEFKHESFVIKLLECLSNFINNDYLPKPLIGLVILLHLLHPRMLNLERIDIC